ncbi:DUF4835 family protein [Reichenbachiella sp. MALMAid0571]|uniref:type IX secretion system protein PorD n=1 Tax=Reichenbachiella sp. MALMAid0571 TaxID=3143939 RepID=UPI0032DFCC19
MHKIIIPICFLILFCLPGYAQELNCRVSVNARQIQSTERKIFEEMETAFSQFMNNRKWTDDEFELEERINCNIILTLESQPSIGNFTATVQVLSARPIYGSAYESVLLNFADRDWAFEYTQSQPLQYNDNTFISNITSLLAYYAYLIIGFDYDSFEKMGGDTYFNKAWQVVNSAQQSGYTGWDQFNSIRNRYWLAENIINAQLKPLRESIYEYHRQGMDVMIDNPDDARKTMLNTLKEIQKVNKIKPRSILTISFMDAKSKEIANIFSDGNLSERREAYAILQEVDPSRGKEYDKIIGK